MDKIFHLSLQVYIEDTDCGGVVYHANYLKFMERARTALLLSKGFSLSTLMQENCLLVVYQAQVSFLKPAKLHDQLMISVKINEISRTAIDFHQTVYLKDHPQWLYCDAMIKIVSVDQLFKLRRLPQQLVESLQYD